MYEDFLISYNVSGFLILYNIFKNISRFFLKRSHLPTTCVLRLHPIIVPFIIYIQFKKGKIRYLEIFIFFNCISSWVCNAGICFCSFFDDLRPYALIQFVPCIAIPVMAILLPPMYTHSSYWLWAAGLCFSTIGFLFYMTEIS